MMAVLARIAIRFKEPDFYYALATNFPGSGWNSNSAAHFRQLSSISFKLLSKRSLLSVNASSLRRLLFYTFLAEEIESFYDALQKLKFHLHLLLLRDICTLLQIEIKHKSFDHCVSIFDMSSTMIKMFLSFDIEVSPKLTNHVI